MRLMKSMQKRIYKYIFRGGKARANLGERMKQNVLFLQGSDCWSANLPEIDEILFRLSAEENEEVMLEESRMSDRLVAYAVRDTAYH